MKKISLLLLLCIVNVFGSESPNINSSNKVIGVKWISVDSADTDSKKKLVASFLINSDSQNTSKNFQSQLPHNQDHETDCFQCYVPVKQIFKGAITTQYVLDLSHVLTSSQTYNNAFFPEQPYKRQKLGKKICLNDNEILSLSTIISHAIDGLDDAKEQAKLYYQPLAIKHLFQLIDANQKRECSLHSQLSDLKKANEDLYQEAVEKDSKTANDYYSLTVKVENLMKEQCTLSSENELLQERANNLIQSITDAEHYLVSANQSLNDKQKHIKQINNQKLVSQQKLDAIKADLRDLEEKLEEQKKLDLAVKIQNLQEKIRTNKEKNQQLIAEIDKEREKNEELDSKNNKYQLDLAKKEDAREKLEAANQKLEAEKTELHKNLNDLTSQTQEKEKKHSDSIADWQSRLNKKFQEAETLKQTLQENTKSLNIQIEQLQGKINNLTDENSKLITASEIAKISLDASQENIATVRQENNNLTQQIHRNLEKLKKLLEEKAAVEKEKANVETEKIKVEGRLGQEIEVLRKEKMNLLEEKTKLAQEKTNWIQEKRDLSAQISQKSNEAKRLTKEKEQLSQDLQKLHQDKKTQLKEKDRNIEEKQNQFNALNQQWTTSEFSLKNTQRALYSLIAINFVALLCYLKSHYLSYA